MKPVFDLTYHGSKNASDQKISQNVSVNIRGMNETPIYPLQGPTPDQSPLDRPMQNTIEHELTKTLLSIYERMLSKNKELVINLIDISGRILLTGTDLLYLVSIVCDVPVSDIRIRYVDEETGCLKKISHIKSIQQILVKNIDMYIGYNEKYNILSGHNISMDKVIV